jgi:hypothetical protein
MRDVRKRRGWCVKGKGNKKNSSRNKDVYLYNYYGR